ncbi:unnamed protein product [Coffea canephora]|uniref:Uncharacterized protein n=1 Tax=Coffea canephora TaxID=49390 RepID=A0A068TR26_COFCA|nr:unnamed protein product [Coffea canephora]
METGRRETVKEKLKKKKERELSWKRKKKQKKRRRRRRLLKAIESRQSWPELASPELLYNRSPLPKLPAEAASCNRELTGREHAPSSETPLYPVGQNRSAPSRPTFRRHRQHSIRSIPHCSAALRSSAAGDSDSAESLEKLGRVSLLLSIGFPFSLSGLSLISEVLVLIRNFLLLFSPQK